MRSKTHPLKSGFTLAELVVSLGIIAAIVTLITISFIQMGRLMREIEIKRSLALYTGSIISTINNDLDELFIRPENIIEPGGILQTITLDHQRGERSVSYSIGDDGQGGKTLERVTTKNNILTEQSTFVSEQFRITNLTLRRTPSPTDTSCTTPPSLHVSMTVERITKGTDTFKPRTTIETILTNGGNPIFYYSYCLGQQTP